MHTMQGVDVCSQSNDEGSIGCPAVYIRVMEV
jgi:hypothetical protein